MLEDLLNPTQRKNYSGMKRTFYVALASDVLTWPTLVTPEVNWEDLVTCTSAFVMKSTKRFWRFEAMVRKNKITFTLAGQRGAKSFVNRVQLKRTDIGDELMGWLTAYMNQPIVLIAETLDGKLRVIGSEALPAFIEEAEGDSGEDVSDDKETMIIIESVGDVAPFYTGLAVPLTPAA